MIRLLQVPLVLGKLVLDSPNHTSRIPFLFSSMAHRNYVFKTLLKWKETYCHFIQSTANFIYKYKALKEHSTYKTSNQNKYKWGYSVNGYDWYVWMKYFRMDENARARRR